MTAQSHGAVSAAAAGSSALAQRERKNVTVLFADIKDSTALIDDLDPEDALSILEPAVDAMAEAVERYGGVVADKMGDGIMALFGCPVSLEDHADRACRAALHIRENFCPGGNAPASIQCDKVKVRVGLNSGVVIETADADQAEPQCGAVGVTVHLASRMESLAAPGTICISQNTYRLVRGQFQCNPLGSQQVKGIAEAVEVYELAHAHPAGGSAPLGKETHLRAPFVGREREILALKERLARLGEGEGSICFLRGEAGIGKTRLLERVRNEMERASGAAWIYVKGMSYESMTYYGYLRQTLSELLGGEGREKPQALEQLRPRVEELLPEQLEEVLPYICVVMGIKQEQAREQEIHGLGGDRVKHQILRAAYLLFRQTACHRPLVLILDDTQWMDSASVMVFEHLLGLVQEAPTLFLFAARAKVNTRLLELRRRAVLQHPQQIAELRLSALSTQEEEAVFDGLVAESRGFMHLRREVLAKAAGNPFFIEEVIRSLIEQGVLQRRTRDGRWLPEQSVAKIEIPDAIQDVIMARVDRLEKELRAVLGVASVMGRKFLYGMLKLLIDEAEQLENRVQALEMSELLDRLSQTPEREYGFHHPLIHDVVYHSMLYRNRRELHKRYAQLLERQGMGEQPEMYSLLAHHYAQAQEWDAVQKYLLGAADQAASLAADDEALECYNKAMASYEKARGEQWDALDQAIIKRKLGGVYFRKGQTDHAATHFQQAAALLGAESYATRGQLRWAILRNAVRQLAHRLAPWLFVSPPSPHIGLADEERIRLSEDITWLAYFTDEERLLLESLKILNHSERIGHKRGMSQGYEVLGYLFDSMGRFSIAGLYHRLALRLERFGGASGTFEFSENLRGIHWFYMGQWTKAEALYRSARAAAWKGANLNLWGSANTMLSFGLYLCGALESALQYGREMVQVGKEAAFNHVEYWGLVIEGGALLRLGRHAEAQQSLYACIDRAKLIPDSQCLARAYGELGTCLIRQGRIEEGMDVLEKARRERGISRVLGHNATPLINALAAGQLALAEHAEPSRRKQQLAAANRACRAALRQARTFKPGAPEAMRLHGTRLWLQGKPKAAERWWRKSIAQAQQWGLNYEAAMGHLELGTVTGNREEEQQGMALLVEMGVNSV